MKVFKVSNNNLLLYSNHESYAAHQSWFFKHILHGGKENVIRRSTIYTTFMSSYLLGHGRNQYNPCFWMLIKSGKLVKEAHDILKGTQKQENNEILFQQFDINYKTFHKCIAMVIIVHSENITSRRFSDDYSYLCKELSGFEQNVNNIKQEYMKLFQSENKLMPYTWVVIRIEDSHFQRFSEVQEFEKPNDELALKTYEHEVEHTVLRLKVLEK